MPNDIAKDPTWNYELRHPGAHDQAVHNPNKGAPIASKMMTPEKLAADRARTKDEMDRLADGATPADRAEAMREYDAAEAAAVKFEQHSTTTSGLFKSESDIGGAAGEAAVKTSKSLAKEYLTIKNRINRKASTARKEGNHARSKAFRIAADGASRLEFSSGLSGFLSSVRGMAVVLEMELRHPGHGDQSTHNPHKGGGAGGFVRPKAIERTFETEMAEKLTDAEWKATAYAHRLTPELTDDTALPSEVPSRIDIKAVEAYQSGSGNFQQAVLSPQTQMEPGVRTQVADFTAVLERNSLQEDTTLYRGMGGVMGGSQMSDNLRFAGVGGVVKTDRFVSSAANSRVAEAFGEADLVIRAPAGTKGAYLDRIVYADPKYAPVRKYDVSAARKIAIPGRGEAEFVMPPGIKFRVDSIGQSPSGRARFEVTVVP